MAAARASLTDGPSMCYCIGNDRDASKRQQRCMQTLLVSLEAFWVHAHLLHDLKVLGVNLPLRLQGFIVIRAYPYIPAQQHQLMNGGEAPDRLLQSILDTSLTIRYSQNEAFVSLKSVL